MVRSELGCEVVRLPGEDHGAVALPDDQRLVPIGMPGRDFSQPVAVLFVASLQFVTDDEDPWGVVSAMTAPLVPGSYLALSHLTVDGRPADLVADIQESYKNASARLVFRDRDAITRLFAGFELVDPGVSHLTEWRSDETERARPGGEWLLGGVGRKPT